MTQCEIHNAWYNSPHTGYLTATLQQYCNNITNVNAIFCAVWDVELMKTKHDEIKREGKSNVGKTFCHSRTDADSTSKLHALSPLMFRAT